MSLLSAQNAYPSLPIVNSLVQNGQATFGVFQQVTAINYLDYYSYLISQKSISQWRKDFKVNQFCFIQIIQPPYRLCLALATIKLASSAFVYLYNDETEQLEICEALQPLTHQASFQGDHYQGQMSFTHSKLRMTLDFSPSQVIVELDSQYLAIRATLERKAQPLAICTPTGRRGWTFTQKEPFSIVSGQLIIKTNAKFNAETQTLRVDFTESTIANLDWTLGYMRHETNWFWSSINSYLPDGRHFLLNLSMGVNETGMSENACWLDGKITYLPPVLFARQDLDSLPQSTWRIYHQNLGWSAIDIDLNFRPITVYKKVDNFGIVASIFEQWIGEYSGEILLGEEIIQLHNVIGLAEDHFAKW